MAIFRAVAGVVIGYLVTAVFIFATFAVAWMVLKADGSFREGSWESSPTWVWLTLGLGLVAAIVGGLVCALIAEKGSKAPIGLCVLIVVLGALSAMAALAQRKAEEQPPPRTADITMVDAMTNARPPMLSLIGNPIVGVIGVLIGAKLRGGGRPAPTEAT